MRSPRTNAIQSRWRSPSSTTSCRTKYDAGGLRRFEPAAAFDVLDLNPSNSMRWNVRSGFERRRWERRPHARACAASCARMRGQSTAWCGFRKANQTCRGAPIARQSRFITRWRRMDVSTRDSAVMLRAPRARSAILVLAHRESDDFAPFGELDYSDAVGPTVHLPTSRRQIDPWASHGVVETDNAFYRNVDQGEMTRALASAPQRAFGTN